MKHILQILALIMLQLPLCGQSEIRTKTKVTDAKIFLQGANLSRTANLNIPQGKSVVIIERLPTDLKFNSVKINFGDEVIIQNISQNVTYLKGMEKSKKTLTLKKKQDSLELLIRYKQLDLDQVTDKMALIKNNSDLDNTSQNVDEGVKKYLALYNTELLTIRRDGLAITLALDTLRSEQRNITAELNSISNIKSEASVELIVEVLSMRAIATVAKLEYYTPNAAWFPKYSARVQSTKSHLDLELKALIVQSTSESWEDVNVTLSNVQPDFEGTLPDLEKWELTYKRLTRNRSNFGNAPVNQVSGYVKDQDGLPLIGATAIIQGTTIGTITDIKGYYELSVPYGNQFLEISYVGYQSRTQEVNREVINVSLNASEEQLDEVLVSGYNKNLKARSSGAQVKQKAEAEFAIVEEKLNAVEYKILEKQTINNSGSSKLIDVQEYELEAKFEHHAIPKLKPDVYIQALVTNWDEYYFLNGEMNVFFENSYVGKSLLGTNLFSDTLFLSLGKDFNVSVERKPLKSSTKKQFLGSNKIVTKTFEIKIRNQKNEIINLFVHDQIPVSIISTIDVELLEKGSATLNTDTGELLWQQQIRSKGSKSLNFSYKVKFPKSEKVILE